SCVAFEDQLPFARGVVVAHGSPHAFGTYTEKTLPLRNVRVFANARFNVFLLPSNIVLPSPRTMGTARSWYSSIKSACASCDTMLPLPRITICSPGSFFIRRTSATRSPLTCLVLLRFRTFTASATQDTIKV